VSARVEELLGVYDADGGVRGELAYVWGRWRGGVHCSLCDITHTTWRRKQEWDALVARTPVLLRVAHRNELSAAEQAAVAGQRLPLVLGRDAGGWRTVVDAERLDTLGGEVDALDSVLREVLAR
jgi:hypothetical protein